MFPGYVTHVQLENKLILFEVRAVLYVNSKCCMGISADLSHHFNPPLPFTLTRGNRAM